MDLNKITYFLITGASRGIGQTIAIECSKRLAPGSIVVLLARTKSGLEETSSRIIANTVSVTVVTIPIDLAKASKEEMHNAIQISLQNQKVKQFERALIVHNAASPGDSSKSVKEMDNLDQWIDYFKLNMFSVSILNSVFMKQFEDVDKVVVNITSLCGIEPFKSLGYYCTGKATREMYFKMLAAEEPNVLVLNYSPGPVDTDMVHDIQKHSNDADLRSYFTEQLEKKTILTPAQTTARFINVLEQLKFKSGDHVDYFDSSL